MSETTATRQSRRLSMRTRLTGEDRDSSFITRIPQCNSHTSLEAKTFNIFGRDVEDDGDGEKGALALTAAYRQSEGVSNTERARRQHRAAQAIPEDSRNIVDFAHESLERREPSVRDKLQVT